MKKIGGTLSIVLLLCSVVAGQQKSEKLLLGGSGWNKIVILDKHSGQIEWEHPLEKGWECNSAVAVPGGNILFSYAKGAKMITRDHQELWDIPAPDACEMQTVRLLPDGNFLLGWVGHPAVIMEVDPEGNILSRTEYDTGIKKPHSQFRQLNKNARGNYLMPLFATSEVREISPEGKLVRTTKLEGTPFTTLARTKRNYWVACGDGHSLLEVNLDRGKVLRRFGENDFQGIRLFFVAGLWPVSGKGLYICNWQGHDRNAGGADSPQLFEIDAKGKVVWRLNDKRNLGMISTVCSMY